MLALVLLGAAGYVLVNSGLGLPRRLPELPAGAAAAPEVAVWVGAALAVLFWLPWLILHQPAQQRRTAFASRLRYGPLAEAVRDLAKLAPADLPPHWDPAAALAREDFAPRLLLAARFAADLPAGNWVRASLLRRLGYLLPVWLDPPDLWLMSHDHMPPDQLARLATLHGLLQSIPEHRELLEPYRDYLTELCAYTQQHDPARLEPLQGLLALSLKRGPGR
jgi:hypothetical protein